MTKRPLCSGEGSPRNSEAEREGWPGLGFTTAKLSEGLRRSESVLRRGEATIHIVEMLCFCFVLFFRCFEDLSIGLIRTL